MRKIIQISAASDGQQFNVLFALCNDGSVWERQWRVGTPWIEHPSIPQLYDYEDMPMTRSSITPPNTLQSLRGGSWDLGPRGCCSAYRFHFRPDDAFYSFGFRVVCISQEVTP